MDPEIYVLIGTVATSHSLDGKFCIDFPNVLTAASSLQIAL